MEEGVADIVMRRPSGVVWHIDPDRPGRWDGLCCTLVRPLSNALPSVWRKLLAWFHHSSTMWAMVVTEKRQVFICKRRDGTGSTVIRLIVGEGTASSALGFRLTAFNS